MQQNKKNYCIIAVICGIVIIAGYFLFPVIQLRGTMWNESFVAMLESAGSADVRNISAWRFLYSFLGDAEPEHYNSIARFYGFKNAAEIIFLYGVPFIGGLGLLITSLSGSGVGIIVSSMISGASYILEIGTFPSYISSAYEFSFWHYLLIVIAVLGIITGFLELSSAKQLTLDAQPYYEKSFNKEKSVHGAKQGTMKGLSGEYKDAVIPIQPGETIVIGREPSSCNLILQNTAVSRIHCYVQYDDSKGDYILRDVSKYGVFDNFDKPIERNVDVRIRPGMIIKIGKTDEVFTFEQPI